MDKVRCSLLYKSVRPIFYASKILGTAPWNYIPCTLSGGKRFSFILKNTKFGITCTWSIFVVIIAQFICTTYWKIMYAAPKMAVQHSIVHFFHGTAFTWTSLILVGLSTTRTRKYVQEIIKNLVEVDAILQVSETHYKKTALYITFLFMLAFVILGSYIVLDSVQQNLSERFLYNDISRDVAFFVITSGQAQFSLLIGILGFRFLFLNKYFNDFIDNQKLTLSRKGKNKKQNAWTTHRSASIQDNSLTQDHLSSLCYHKNTVHQLRECHQKLVDISGLLMNAYGPFLLFLMIFHFFTSILCLYSFITAKENHATLSLSADLALGWGALCALAIFVTVSACQWLITQANSTSGLVNKALLQQFPQSCSQALVLFSVQLLHSNLQLSVCGFFKMNFSMLLSFLGSFATYLVLMLQYKL